MVTPSRGPFRFGRGGSSGRSRWHPRSGPTLAEASARSRERNNFDLLRLVAAMSVVLAHSFDLLNLPEPSSPFKDISWAFFGLVLFFSISGFLVARSWTANPRMLSFVIKRSLRLMPGLAVVLLLSALVLGPLVTVEPTHAYFLDPATKAYVLNNITMQSDFTLPGVFVHNVYPSAVNGSLWTLPLEVKAYVLIAIVGLLALRTRVKSWLLLVPAAVLVTLICVDGLRGSIPLGNTFVGMLTNIQSSPATAHLAASGAYDEYAQLFAAFAVGAALYSLRGWVRLNWTLAALALVAIYAGRFLSGQGPILAVAVIEPYLVLCIAYLSPPRLRLPRRFGDYSYGVYIYAFPVQQTISMLLAISSGWILFALSAPITLVFAVLSWHLIERPALRLKQRLSGGEKVAGLPVTEPTGEVEALNRAPIAVS